MSVERRARGSDNIDSNKPQQEVTPQDRIGPTAGAATARALAQQPDPRDVARSKKLGVIRMYLVGLRDNDLSEAAKLISEYSKACREIPKSAFLDCDKLRESLLQAVDTLNVETLKQVINRLEEKGNPRLGQPAVR
jgi:hypothetical protein